jgi:UDP-N-acetyl-D-mannosaminuronate dehydrogenase
VVEKAQGLELAQMLLDDGTPVVVHDPCAMDAAREQLSGDVRFAESAADCARLSDVLVICTPCKEFTALTLADVRRPHDPRTIIDCWRLLDGGAAASACHYVPIGVAPSSAPRLASHRESEREGMIVRASRAA